MIFLHTDLFKGPLTAPPSRQGRRRPVKVGRSQGRGDDGREPLRNNLPPTGLEGDDDANLASNSVPNTRLEELGSKFGRKTINPNWPFKSPVPKGTIQGYPVPPTKTDTTKKSVRLLKSAFPDISDIWVNSSDSIIMIDNCVYSVGDN
tara:strand:- start:1711 stop:2154 length:444 start_codon:yes stop_codon:yes gene_type:complete